MEEEKQYLEEQFILRLPREEADYVRNLLATKPKKVKKRLQIALEPDNLEGHVWVNKKELKGHLKKLPTIVESLKTHNRVYCVKTADITQILDCQDGGDGAANVTADTCSTVMTGGLTAPLKNCKKKRFRKGLVNKDEAAVNVQKELFYLLQADLEAVSTRFEIIYEQMPNVQNAASTSNPEKSSEIELFGNVLTDSEETDSNIEDVEQ